MTTRLSIATYLNTVRAKYATGDATEHSYRAALEALFEGIGEGLTAVNEPRRVACGAPDFVVKRGGIDIGHCEAKDLHIDLAKLKDANADQKKRYLKALPNLIYTNGLDFEFYKAGEKVRRISIGTLSGGKIEAQPDEFDTLANQLSAFAAERPQSITSAKKLAEMMAGKAVLIKDIMGNALRADAHLQTELTSQYAAFKAHLIHDIDADEFADVYAETIAYGLFAARLHDNSIDNFDRREALELLPKSNPFLRSLFGYIAGVDLDDRIAWVIDELCEVLRACNVHELMADFGKWTARNDPFLHFYETFLAEYNPAKRKARGVWYTPEPVVNFIVRAVDDVLKSEFGLPMGLADTSKITVDWDTGQVDKKGNRTTIKKDVHRVQILDPATGTGTFLAEAIKQIAAKVQGVAPGMWSKYVEDDLIPRIHGFELLMASYAMCHMKIDMMLSDLGYLDNPTFRGMRHHLLKTFDKIFVLDLHGNSNKKEVSPDGSPDKNVFDIQQGVAILIGIKLTASPSNRSRRVKSETSYAEVSHLDLWGTRESKYDNLWNLGRKSEGWASITPELPLLMLRPRDYGLAEIYGKGFALDQLFPANVSGVITARDDFIVDEDRDALARRVKDFGSDGISDTDFQNRFALSENYQWKCAEQRRAFPGFDPEMMKPILYRQFDRKTIYYQDNLVFRTRRNVMRHMYQGDNVALLSPRITGDDYAPFVSREMISNKAASRYDQSYIFPLYLYPDPKHPVYTETGHLDESVRVNFDLEIYAAIRAAAGLDKEPLRQIHDSRDGGKPDELRVFDYIYGVLHSPEYRATYAQFLKIDFPRIPHPVSPKVFADVAEKGGQLRRLHLMEDAAVGETPYAFQGNGSGEVVKPEYEAGRVHINSDQWFDNVPAVAWGFHIGGYQPAQKWLKDRKGRALSFDDVRHYQKIIKILVETDRIMNEIELPL